MDKITPEIIQSMVREIVSHFRPLKVVLFGSWARGNAGAESDVDLLIVQTSEEPRYKRPGPIRKLLRKYLFAKDILVYTPEEINQWANVPQAFITTVMSTGKVLYEKQA